MFHENIKVKFNNAFMILNCHSVKKVVKFTPIKSHAVLFFVIKVQHAIFIVASHNKGLSLFTGFVPEMAGNCVPGTIYFLHNILFTLIFYIKQKLRFF